MDTLITELAEPHFEGVRQVLDHVAREKRFLAFTQAPCREEAEAFYRRVLAQGDVFNVLLAEGRVVGWCDVLSTHGQARAHVGTLGIGILPEWRHHGLGRTLIEHTLARALARGFSRIELSVIAGNLNAKALYERVGFVTEGRLARAFRIDGHDHDGYAMALLA